MTALFMEKIYEFVASFCQFISDLNQFISTVRWMFINQCCLDMINSTLKAILDFLKVLFVAHKKFYKRKAVGFEPTTGQ